MFFINLRSIILLLVVVAITTAQKCTTSNNKYFIPNDEKVDYLDASQACVKHGGVWADVNFGNYHLVRQVMDTCFPKGIQVWIRSFGSPENTSKCMRVPSGPGPIKEPITFNCDDKTYPICTQIE